MIKIRDILEKRAANNPFDTGVILSANSSFMLVEAYRKLRTSLEHLCEDGGCRKVAVTSACPAEGKTVTAINLSISLAQNGKRVLLIDADLRKPTVHRYFDIKNDYGLSNWLSAEDDSGKEGFIHAKSVNPNLYLLTAGPTLPYSTELLASPTMEDLLNAANGLFDYVVLDTPPLNMVTDASILAPNIFGYLMAVRANQSTLGSVEEAVQSLEKIEANILGFVLNSVPAKQLRRYGRYRRSKYYEEYKY